MCVPTKKHLSLSALFIYLFIGRGGGGSCGGERCLNR